MERGVGMKEKRTFESGKRKRSEAREREGRQVERAGGVRILLSHLSPLISWISFNKACPPCGSVTFLISIRLHLCVHHQIMNFP